MKKLSAILSLSVLFLASCQKEIIKDDEQITGEVVASNNTYDGMLETALPVHTPRTIAINLIVRSVCCLIPGELGMSQNIVIKRIVDRYLEHGRIFIFHNNGNRLVFMGSSDWMNRNIYRRIEVCFPVYDEELKNTIEQIVDIQLRDNVQAVTLNQNIENVFLSPDGMPVRSQQEIAALLKDKQFQANL